jgi:hypothetical protein
MTPLAASGEALHTLASVAAAATPSSAAACHCVLMGLSWVAWASAGEPRSRIRRSSESC